MSDAERIAELRSERFYCSQVIVKLLLELQGVENPAVVRAAEGLAGGLGFTGETCGALTGGAIGLGLYAGRGRAEDDDDPNLIFMIEDLVKWFKEGFGAEYGGIRCAEILAGDPQAQLTRCPLLVTGTLQKAKELLVANGFDLTADPDAED